MDAGGTGSAAADVSDRKPAIEVAVECILQARPCFVGEGRRMLQVVRGHGQEVLPPQCVVVDFPGEQ
jgi:hypothetical protein